MTCYTVIARVSPYKDKILNLKIVQNKVPYSPEQAPHAKGIRLTVGACAADYGTQEKERYICMYTLDILAFIGALARGITVLL